MHPRPALSFLRSSPPKATNAYICPTCCFHNVVNQVRRVRNPGLRLRPSTRRTASTITSVTAVNAPKAIPPAFRELHDALSVLQRDAAVYTNLSQLQLALRGLESENGITRIAGMSDGQLIREKRLLNVDSSWWC